MKKPIWEYCECGCHGYCCEGTRLWWYWDLKDQNLLFEGHGFQGRKLGNFKTKEELNVVAVEYINKEIQKLSASMEE